ncbi:MAG: hypothetical protein EXS52_00305 [Candidatus Staskawiczbacteria bacterium]|nr:hypothetical protein [Candidatus Staskawiczbacteria bacterium]
MVTWDQIYDLLGIKEFMYFISSPALQQELLPIKLVFYAFTLFFFCAVIYFYINSSYLRYKFLQDTAEFFSWQPYGLRSVNKRWNAIMKKTESGAESDYKLAIVEADDFLYQVLEEGGYEGETFEELVTSASRKMPTNLKDVLEAHETRNLVVYDLDYKLDVEFVRRILSNYEIAIKNIAMS